MTIITVSHEPVGADQSACGPASWRQSVKRAVRHPGELCRLLDLPSELAKRATAAHGDFPLFVPRELIARMRPGDPNDPLLRQVLPLDAETAPVEGFLADPVGDVTARRSPGLLSKYRGRVLLVTTGACAVHCRYCFRRHYPYGQNPHAPRDWQPAIGEIARDRELREVILSGGDPLMLIDRHLAELAQQLAAISHLTRLRVHTRLPIMIPQRVTEELLRWLTGSRLAPVMVVHVNHAAEIDGEVAAALTRLVEAGVPVLNQAVLLRGVNDSVAAMAELCERLVDLRVMPYYLHQLDRVAGAAHFEVPVAQGLQIINELRARLPGYAVPRYVQEIAGRPGKTVLA
ncbi:MAG: EF-P beta-lysylation protein EpmB [Pirellulales bacterium]